MRKIVRWSTNCGKLNTEITKQNILLEKNKSEISSLKEQINVIRQKLNTKLNQRSGKMGCAGFSNTIKNTKQTINDKPPTYQEILNQDKKTLPTYQEAKKFEKGTDAFDYFKESINSIDFHQPSTSGVKPKSPQM